MAEETSFATMGRAAAANDIPEIGVGMLGYAFMGKAHSNGFKTRSIHAGNIPDATTRLIF